MTHTLTTEPRRVQQPNGSYIVKDNIVAVDQEYFWRRIDEDTPRNVKVQLLGIGGVGVYGTYDGKNKFWRGWAPMPSIPEWMK